MNVVDKGWVQVLAFNLKAVRQKPRRFIFGKLSWQKQRFTRYSIQVPLWMPTILHDINTLRSSIYALFSSAIFTSCCCSGTLSVVSLRNTSKEILNCLVLQKHNCYIVLVSGLMTRNLPADEDEHQRLIEFRWRGLANRRRLNFYFLSAAVFHRSSAISFAYYNNERPSNPLTLLHLKGGVLRYSYSCGGLTPPTLSGMRAAPFLKLLHVRFETLTTSHTRSVCNMTSNPPTVSIHLKEKSEQLWRLSCMLFHPEKHPLSVLLTSAKTLVPVRTCKTTIDLSYREKPLTRDAIIGATDSLLGCDTQGHRRTQPFPKQQIQPTHGNKHMRGFI